MNRISKKFISLALATAMLSGTAAMAADFTDMPSDWTAPAVEKAIENGLLGGYPDNTIRPDNNIKRAEMAAIVARCFKATSTAELSKFVDVTEDAWFYEEFAKAVSMGAFNGDDQNRLNPEKNITFQETFKVMASIFGMIAYTNLEDSRNDITNQDLTVLDQFDDGAEVADWAKPYVAAIVEKGYWKGIDNKLLPKQYITRAQFAVLMDNLVKTYIDEPGEYKELTEGNILIRTDGVTLDAEKFDSSIIVAESVSGKNPININIDQLSGLLTIRGGADQVTFSGHVNKFSVVKPGIAFNINDTDIWNVKGYAMPGSSINLGTLNGMPASK